jgi:hypothetical protein
LNGLVNVAKRDTLAIALVTGSSTY